MSIKVTIITVVKNDEKFILRTLNSIDKQNYNNIVISNWKNYLIIYINYIQKYILVPNPNY